MTLEWSVVKYIPDLWRNEPVNVGVVVRSGASARLRFFAESEAEPGKVDGRTARKRTPDTDSYKEWVAYFRRKLANGRWEDVLEAQRRRPDFPYVLQPGGSLPESSADTIQIVTDDLYRDLVDDVSESSSALDADDTGINDNAKQKVVRILSKANITVVEGVKVPALFHARNKSAEVRQDVRFTFGYRNGRHHLFEPVPNRQAAYSFFARAEAAFNADRTINLLAMYPSSKFSQGEAELNVMETYSNAVDIDDEDLASRSVADLVRGPHT